MRVLIHHRTRIPNDQTNFIIVFVVFGDDFISKYAIAKPNIFGRNWV
jgi:hypothetical protein